MSYAFHSSHHTRLAARLGLLAIVILGFGATAEFLISTPPAELSAPCPALFPGDRFKVRGHSAVYLLNDDLRRLYFPHADVYFTWFKDYYGIKEITSNCVDDYPIPSMPPYGVNYRPGTQLVKLKISNSVYVVEPGNKLAKLGSEEVAEQLYGANWRRLVKDVSDEFWPNFTSEAAPITEPKPHDGMIVRTADTQTTYYVQNGQLKPLTGELTDLAGARVFTLPTAAFTALTIASSTVPIRNIPTDPAQASATIFFQRAEQSGFQPLSATSTIFTSTSTIFATTTIPGNPTVVTTSTVQTGSPTNATSTTNSASPQITTRMNPNAPGVGSTATTTTSTLPGGTADTTPPLIYNVQATNITQNSATISWNTNEQTSTTSLYYSLQAQGAYPWRGPNPGNGTAHSASISSLWANSTYYYWIVAVDLSGNTATSSEYTFQTLSPGQTPTTQTTTPTASSTLSTSTTSTTPADTTPPTITSISASNVTASGATITWTTTEAGTSEVSYANIPLSSATPTIARSTTLTTSHSVSLQNLSESMSYYFTVTSQDSAGNAATSSERTFTTASTSTPPTTPATSSAPTVKWSTSTFQWIMGGPAIGSDGNTAYFSESYGKIHALNPDGTRKWLFNAGGDPGAPTVATDGTVYVSGYLSGNNKLFAINPDGTEKWHFNYSGSSLGSAAIAADGTVYFSVSNGTLYAVNPDGTLKWSLVGVGQQASSPAVAADGTIFLSRAGILSAVNPDGTIKWQFNLSADNSGGIFYTAPAIGADGTIYLGSSIYYGSSGKNFFAVNPDGTKKWSAFIGYVSGGYYSPTIGADNTVYVSSGDTSGVRGLFAFTPEGVEKWNFLTAHGVATIGANGLIYIGGYNNLYYALNPDGTISWSWTVPVQYNTTGRFSGAIANDGTLYTASANTIYALNVGASGLANSPWPKFHKDNQNTGR